MEWKGQSDFRFMKGEDALSASLNSNQGQRLLVIAGLSSSFFVYMIIDVSFYSNDVCSINPQLDSQSLKRRATNPGDGHYSSGRLREVWPLRKGSPDPRIILFLCTMTSR